MGVSASNRGTRLISRQADAGMSAIHARMDRESSERDILRARIRELEGELKRAKRALALSRLTVTEERARIQGTTSYLEDRIQHVLHPVAGALAVPVNYQAAHYMGCAVLRLGSPAHGE